MRRSTTRSSARRRGPTTRFGPRLPWGDPSWRKQRGRRRQGIRRRAEYDAPGEQAEVQRTAARIGKARCMVLGNKTDQALRSLNEIIERTDENKYPEVNAMAYNALGTALRKAGKPKEAILAFLHVHLSYSTLPDLDAEAVANLVKLFTEDHKPDHAREMRHILDENTRTAAGPKA